MQRVDQALIVGVRMHSRHEAILDTEGVIEHLGQRREAVRRAGGIGDDEVPLRIELILVHTNDEGGVGIVGGGGDHDAGRAGFEVFGCPFPLGVLPGRLDDDIDCVLMPWESPLLRVRPAF